MASFLPSVSESETVLDKIVLFKRYTWKLPLRLAENVYICNPKKILTRVIQHGL